MKNKHKKTYCGKATKRIKTKRRWLVLAIALVVGITIILIADTKTAAYFQIKPEVKTGYPISATKKDLTVEDQIRIIAQQNGFKYTEYLVRLANCESKMNQYAIGNNGNSVDRGLFQINSYWHKEVSSECAFSIRCATEWTINMINKGQQNQWTCNELAKK
jgi:hypothetical protein